MPCISQWRDMWHQFGRSAPDAVFQDLMDRYSEPHRRYHTIQHLDECLAKLCEIESVALRPREIEFALWFHDAIYDVKRHDNEQRSAERARSTLLDAGLIATTERVHALIMVTRHDAVPKNIDERVLVDGPGSSTLTSFSTSMKLRHARISSGRSKDSADEVGGEVIQRMGSFTLE